MDCINHQSYKRFCMQASHFSTSVPFSPFISTTDQEKTSSEGLPRQRVHGMGPQTPLMSDQAQSDRESSGADEQKTGNLSLTAFEKLPLAEPHKEMLLSRLYRDSVDIVKHFSRLRTGTELYLQKKDTSVQVLVTCVMDLDPITYPGQPSPLNELRYAESVSDVFRILVDMKIVSFLQYSIVENIITNLCKENAELTEELEEYKAHFSRYIQARVFESYLFQEREYKVAPNVTPHLVIITDETWDKHKTFVNIHELKMHVVKILDIQEFYLNLKSISANCLKLKYAVPTCIKELVFPLTPEQEDKLRECGITELYFKDYHYIMEKKGKDHTVDIDSPMCTPLCQEPCI